MDKGELVLSTSLQEKVVEKIKNSFMEFIPDIAWNELVKKEVELFIEKELKNLIHAELAEYCKMKVKKEMDEPEFSQDWDRNGRQVVGVSIKQMLKELAPELVASLFDRLTTDIINQVRSNLHQY